MGQKINPDRPGIATKILLVDDEDFFRTALKKQLHLRGYEVKDVRSGNEAIPVVRSSKPEVVILDQMMPVMDGFQTMKEIKRIHPAAQVIMLTGYGGAEAACEAGKPSVFRCLKKPCGIEEITASIEAAVLENAHVNTLSLKQWILGLFFKRYRSSGFSRRL
jgi:solute carrier family 13 (sodium-dependent dicarboxylate transporter), member 2/3/5